jgi:fermentation-respiration switch protein FrsA (DUF1100 family)
MIERMDSNRFAAFALTAFLALPAAAYNHVNTVAPTAQGPFTVACSNVAQDASRIAPGLQAQDYWEGRDHYITELLSAPGSAITYDVRVPFDPLIYPGNFGRSVPFAAIVCYPTPQSNTDPDYQLPGTTDFVPHMQPAGLGPKLISAREYSLTLTGGGFPEAPVSPQPLPLIMYSHGLGGSPISAGYLQAMALLASHGYMVAGVFHGDARFSPIHVENVPDAIVFLASYNLFVNMELMRPLSLIALTDKLTGDPQWSAGINQDQIGGFGASMGGEAMLHLLGADITTATGFACSHAPRDTRIKAAVGYVPYAGQTFLPAFCDQQSGVDNIDKPFLALSGTADTTAPIKLVDSALRRMKGSRYLIQLEGVPHEFKAEYAGDLLTWMVTFFRGYLQHDRASMDKLVRMQTVTGGPVDTVRLDYHMPDFSLGGDTNFVAKEFRNTILNHYFLTPSSQEIANILNGGAGPGWVLTGQQFKVTDPSLFSPPPPGVCRFYGGRNGGPNSHFYTAVPSECEFVKAGGAGPWAYEGTGFYIQPIGAQQSCPAGYIGVNRAYNQRAAQNDSNHRFSTSDSTMHDMEGEGWAYEATVMCAAY